MTDGRDDETTALAVPRPAPADRGPAPADGSPAPADGRPAVMLLGSGDISRELAIALGRLGARVIAVDAHPQAPAHAVADQALVLPSTDAGELSAAIHRLRPDVVVSTTDAVAVPALEALDGTGAEPVPSARAVRLAADREGLRRLAADELGLPTAPFWFAGSLGELEAVGAHAGYPLLVKPVVGAVGPRQSVVAGREDIAAAWHRAVDGQPGARVLAETVVEVQFHVTLLAVRSEGAAGPAIEFCSPIGHRGAGGRVLESWQPQKMSPAAMDAAKSIAARIVKALGGRGVFGVELMVNDDEVYFADVTAHPGDSAWVTVRSQRLSAFELQARTILGLPVDTMMVSPAAARVVDSADPGDRAALSGALGVPESDLRVCGGGFRALATAPAVSRAAEPRRRRRDGLDTIAGQGGRQCVPRRGDTNMSTERAHSYAGDVSPLEAWKLLSDNPNAVLVDVRTDAEWRFVGVPDLSSLGREVVFLEWNTSDGRHNPDFADQLRRQIEPAPAGQERPVLFLCRSGNRSIGAAEVATQLGITPAYNVLDGFEGHLDANGHRGETGWRAIGLPWKQG